MVNSKEIDKLFTQLIDACNIRKWFIERLYVNSPFSESNFTQQS